VFYIRNPHLPPSVVICEINHWNNFKIITK